MALVIPFFLELKELKEGFVVMSFLYYYDGSAQVNEVIHGGNGGRG